MTELINSILDLSQVQALHVDFSRLQKIPRQQAEQRQIILFDRDADKFVHVLTTNNHPEELKNFLAQLTNQGVKYKVFYTSLEGFLHAVTWYDQLEQQQEQELQQLQIQQQAKGQSAITIMKELFQKRATFDPGKFIMELVRLSFQSGASDLHFQPSDTFVVLRLRLDGILHDILQFDIKDFGKYLQKLKFISGVKMNVNSLPQDGRFSFESHTPQGEIKKIDARVSFIPGLLSESTVIRFLDSSRKISTFQDIGFLDREYNILKPYLAKTTGIIIVAGPTGSGKTTTLYTALQTLNT
ncbi:Flp pilus assembly complex ATPase component TadA [bacterium]|nr:Flp pilus assembly complex ATPase component TadA [bacterium]